MKKISVTILFVLALALLVGCTNAATGGTGSGSETENDYLAPLLGTWKTEGYDEGKFVEAEQTPGDIWEVRCIFKFTKEKLITTIYNKVWGDQPYIGEVMIQSVDEKNIYTVDSSGYASKAAYRLDNINGKKLLYFDSFGTDQNPLPLYWSN